MTTRRGFLSLLGASIATASLDPDRLLWVPGQKTISIPAQSVLVSPLQLGFIYQYWMRCLDGDISKDWADGYTHKLLFDNPTIVICSATVKAPIPFEG